MSEEGCEGYDCSFPDAQPYPRVVLLAVIDRWTRFELWHELGHVYSWRHRHDSLFRRAVKGALGWRGWREEQFAMAYSWCAWSTRTRALGRYVGYDYWPSLAQHRAVCRAILTTS